MKSSLGLLRFVRAPQCRAPGFLARLPLVVAFAALLFVAGACRTAPRANPVPYEPPSSAPVSTPQNDTAPAWLTEPLSWEKMKTIETWLVTDGPHSSNLWRIEGELVLNLGRLELARRELAKANEPPTLNSRIRTAKAGLEHVMSEIDATPAQRKRAQSGLARAQTLLAQNPTTQKGIGVPVIARAAWGASPAHLDRMEKTQGPYTRITVHHSADKDPVSLDGSSAKTFEAVREIQHAHMDGKETGYGDIGYHFVIDPYGRVLEGRELVYKGAHAYGDNNIGNIGICLIGNFDKEKPTKAALESLQRVIEHLRKTYTIPRSRVYGHRELRSTECPGDNLMKWIQSYRR